MFVTFLISLAANVILIGWIISLRADRITTRARLWDLEVQLAKSRLGLADAINKQEEK